MRKKTTIVWGGVKQRPTEADVVEFFQKAVAFSGKTEKELCEQANISPRTFRRWLTEPKRPNRIKMMQFIAVCYGPENVNRAVDDLMAMLDKANERSRAAQPERYQQLMDHLAERKQKLITRGWLGFKKDE